MGSNTEKVLLMINPMTTDRADVIGTYVYNIGLRNAQYSYSAAVGLFANVINFVLVFGTNWASRRFTSYSLW
jgi:putative aldouronate transport system permease protein